MSKEVTPATVPAPEVTPAPTPAPAPRETTFAEDVKPAPPAPTPDDKPADPPAPKPDDKPADPPKPEEVKYELKAPEGVKLPEGHVEKTVAYAKANGLTPVQAQALLDRDAALAPGGSLFKARNEAWKTLAYADKEVGGTKFEESVKLAEDSLSKYGDDEFRGFLKEHGLSHHPAAVRFFSRVGRDLQSDRHVKGDKPTQPALTPVEQFYGKDYKG